MKKILLVFLLLFAFDAHAQAYRGVVQRGGGGGTGTGLPDGYTASDTGNLIVCTATANGDTCFKIVLKTGQTANAFQIDDSSGNQRVVVDNTGAFFATDATIYHAALYEVQGKEVDLGSTSGTVTLDLATARGFEVTLTDDATFTIDNAPAAGFFTDFSIRLTNGGAHTITWTDGTWDGGTPPALTASGSDIITAKVYDQGALIVYSLANKDYK